MAGLIVSPQQEWFLIHGLFAAEHTAGSACLDARLKRSSDFSRHADGLGLSSYQWLDGGDRKMANRFLRRLRGTACPVDAVEVMVFKEAELQKSLGSDAGRDCWQKVAGLQLTDFDMTRSFVLMGQPLRLLEGEGGRQKILWFGNGLEHLSQAEFIEHYTTGHGPLVTRHATVIGLRNYLQVPSRQCELADHLRELGLGRASPPAVFAQLEMAAPAFKLSSILARRSATREIKVDEQRHIDFSHSMLLLSGSFGLGTAGN